MKVLTGCVISWIMFLAILLTVDSWAGQTTIRPNTSWGQPDYTKKGLVVENRRGRTVIREETFARSGIGNKAKRGVVIERERNGTYTGRRETYPGSGRQDRNDRGFTIDTE